MHPVMARRVQDPLERPERADGRRVDPELIDQVELLMHEEMGGRHKQGQRQVHSLSKQRDTKPSLNKTEAVAWEHTDPSALGCILYLSPPRRSGSKHTGCLT